MTLYIGCAIWGHKTWVGNWLPATTQPRDMLAEYSQRLSMVEINATFYGLPEQTTIERWRDQTPTTFRFCPKVPRIISHAPRLADTTIDTAHFIKRIQQLDSRLGTVFLQLSPRFSPHQKADLIYWLDQWPTHVPLAVEVRHPAWYTDHAAEELNHLLAQRSIGRVIVDSRPIFTASSTAEHPLVKNAQRKKPLVPLHLGNLPAKWILVRFMGHLDPQINTPFLQAWAAQLYTWLQQGQTIFFAMHCPDEDLSPDMCYELARYIEEKGFHNPLPYNNPTPQQLTFL